MLIFLLKRSLKLSIFLSRYEVGGYWNEIDIWFSNAVGRPCTLVRSYAVQNQTRSNREQCIVGMCRDFETRLNFVNEAQFLLLLEESVSDLNNRIRSSTLLHFFPHLQFFFCIFQKHAFLTSLRFSCQQSCVTAHLTSQLKLIQ